MVKSILVPTDFSPNAKAAFFYAVELAAKCNAKITLFHLVSVIFTDPDLSPAEKDQVYEDYKASMKQKAEDLLGSAKDKGVEVAFVSGIGEARDSILHKANSGKFDLVVMGTKGASGLKGVFMGSNTSHLLQHTTVPVLAIPLESTWKGFSTILAGINYQEGEMENFQYLVNWQSFFNSKLVLVHVADKELTKNFEQFLIDEFRTRLKVMWPDLQPQVLLLQGKDTVKEIQQEAENQSADLLVLFAHQRSFLGRLLSPSLTSKIAFNPTLPFLVIPTKSS